MNERETSDNSGTALRTKIAGGIRWGFIVSISTQIARILFLVVLMRLLGPRNYGIAGQAAVFIAIAQIFVYFGLAAAIVQRPQLASNDVGTAFWLNVAMGTLLGVSTILAAPLLAAFFKTEELSAVLRVLSICFVLKGMTVVPSALLTRSMDFRRLGVVEILSALVSGILGVVAAFLGAGYWAVVVQSVSLELAYLLLILPASRINDFTCSAAAARRLWSFSSRVMGADLVNYIATNSDKVLVARILGPTMLGLYTLAFRILQLTLTISAQAGRVVLPTFARLQNDRGRLARAYLAVTETVSLAVFPTMTLAILVAPVAVPAVFGDEWRDAVVPLQLIAAMTMPYVLLSNMGPLTVAVGRADWEFGFSILSAVVALVSFSLGIQWGIVGISTSYLIMVNLLHVIRLVITKRLIPLSARTYIRSLAPALTCSAVLCVVFLLISETLGRTVGGLTLVVVASIASSSAYVFAFRWLWPADFRRQIDFARLVVRGGQNAHSIPT